MNEIVFANLKAVYLGLVLLVVALFAIGYEIRRSQMLGSFFSEKARALLFSERAVSLLRKASLILFFLGALSTIIASMRPQYGYSLTEVKKSGVDLWVLMDVSNSMLAEDVKPNRLERQKRELKDFLNMIQGDRIGLIPFAGRAYVAVPGTTDYSAVNLFLDQIDVDIMDKQGTDINQAVQIALDKISNSQQKNGAIILMTDGEYTVGELDPVAEKLAEAHIPLYAMGFGTKEGAPIPDRQGGGFKKDASGQTVITHLGEDELKRISEKTGGLYVPSVVDDSDWAALYKNGIKAKLTDQDYGSQQKKVPHEWYQWPLGVGVLLLVLAEMLAQRSS